MILPQHIQVIGLLTILLITSIDLQNHPLVLLDLLGTVIQVQLEVTVTLTQLFQKSILLTIRGCLLP